MPLEISPQIKAMIKNFYKCVRLLPKRKISPRKIFEDADKGNLSGLLSSMSHSNNLTDTQYKTIGKILSNANHLLPEEDTNEIEERLKGLIHESERLFSNLVPCKDDDQVRPGPEKTRSGDEEPSMNTEPHVGPRVDVWIHSHDRQESLILGKSYKLMVKVGALKTDDVVTAKAEATVSITSKYENVIFDVSLVGDAFEIENPVMQISLDKNKASKMISFLIKPLQAGRQHISVYFYYKVNLLLVLSIPLHILEERTRYPRSETNWNRDIEVIASSEKGLESIFDIDQVAKMKTPA